MSKNTLFTQVPSAATHSSLDLFQKPSVLVNFDQGTVQETYPLTGLDGPTLEFELRTDRNSFLDMTEIYLKLVVTVTDVQQFTPVDEESRMQLVNNALHSMFQNCDVSLNGEHVSTSNSLYAHKAFITTEWSHTQGCKSSILQCQGYKYENNPGKLKENFDNAYYSQHNQWNDNPANDPHFQSTYFFFGKLAVDLFSCEKLLVPKCLLRIKLIKNTTDFFLKWCGDPKIDKDDAGNPVKPPQPGTFGVKFTKASLLSRQMLVAENVYSSIERALMKSPARYSYTETEAKTFIVPSGQNSFVKENIFNNRPIRSLAIAMNTNESFNGKLMTSPFHYRDFGLQRLILYRNGNAIYNISMKEGGHVQLYHNTLKSLHFYHDGPNVPLEQYKNHFVMVSDLTSTQQSNDQVYYPELIGGALRLEMVFEQALKSQLKFYSLENSWLHYT